MKKSMPAPTKKRTDASSNQVAEDRDFARRMRAKNALVKPQGETRGRKNGKAPIYNH